MPTRPKNDVSSIALDARRVLDAARADLHDADFKRRISKHELDGFEANISALESGSGARTSTLHGQVAAGVHVARARAAVLALLIDVRDDAKLAFPADPVLQHAFGVGASVSPTSTAAVRHEAEVILAGAHEHKAEAAKIGLDAHGIHHLEDLVHALDGLDLTHVHAVTSRHTNATATDSLAHVVAAEAAHVRLAARRVFRAQPDKLAAYARTLPRHEIMPRAKPAPAIEKPAQ